MSASGFSTAAHFQVGHEHGVEAARDLCGSSDATALATHITETLTAYYRHAGAVAIAALAVGLFFLCWHALQQACEADAEPPQSR